MRLRHVNDRAPGFTRRRRGGGFEYRSADGRPVGDAHRRRIQSLAIPPAWERVWICPDPRGHLQATGYDARGRKQYRYHTRWGELRNESKFDQLAAFGRALPGIRRHVARDLARADTSLPCVLACVVTLLDRAHLRIGNDEYARDNNSFGLTTIRNRHARVRGDHVTLRFRGKSGVERTASLRSARAARVIRRCQDLPGQELFAYTDAGGRARDVTSTHVNAYLARITGDRFTSKHFRTWAGSVVALQTLHGLGLPDGPPTAREAKAREVGAIDAAARALGNTRAVCRRYYVHPRILEADRAARIEACFTAPRRKPPAGLSAPERALLRLLEC